jgi:CDP-diacylglycerol--glycerol-3-phosphate 3-phosphatidyltransferase
MMTTANKVTLLRILLIPPFIYCMLMLRVSGQESLRWAGLGFFAMAALLDGVDGFIARRFHQRSELGAVLDPLADKLLLVSAVVVLSLPHSNLATLPLWFALAVLSRDVLAVIGLGVVHFMVGRVALRPRWTGKTATVLQMVAVLWTMLRWPLATRDAFAAGAAVLTLVSGLQYAWDGLRRVGAGTEAMDGRR